MASQTTCPYCGQSIDFDGLAALAACEHCDEPLPLAGHLCPGCGAYSDNTMPICPQCGEATSRVCPSCGEPSWAGVDECGNCGSEMDIVQYVSGHTPQANRDRMQREMRQSAHLKAVEQQASEARMAEMMEIEARRQSDLKQRLASQRAQERKLLTVVFGGAAVILFIVVIIILFT